MAEPESEFAWLERVGAEGIPIQIQESCSIGRAPSSDIVLTNPNVSRHHALIHTQGGKNFFIIDLGSKNGTYVDGRRVQHPSQLNDRSEIAIGPFCFLFRQPKKRRQTETKPSTVVQGTLIEIKTSHSWLMVGDLVNSTQLAREIGHDEAVKRTSNWLSFCKTVIEANGGVLNKFLGDGFIAYWPDPDHQKQAEVAAALEQLNRGRGPDHPAFRIVLHFGEVSMGGAASLGEENLCGQAVIFAFRMEKLAAALGLGCMVSENAQECLGDALQTLDAGRHCITGFEGEHLFFKYQIPQEMPHIPQLPDAHSHPVSG
jgi:adenylate cyclase